jgi:hypothetical protein
MSHGSALVIAFDAVDRVVGPHRLRHDPSAALGVPAHVTIHYPWRTRAEVDESTLAELRSLARAIEPFPVTFAEFKWFDASVLWLAPSPDQPFRHLAELSAAQWPDRPLYNGQFADVVPHLTVGDLHRGGDAAALRQVPADLADALPLHEQATHLRWLAQDAVGRWVSELTVPLGADVNLS